MFSMEILFFKTFRPTIVDFMKLELMNMESLVCLWWLLEVESEMSLPAHILNAWSLAIQKLWSF